MQLAELWPMLAEGTLDTLRMVLISTALGYLIGLPLGVLLTITNNNGISPHPVMYRALDLS